MDDSTGAFSARRAAIGTTTAGEVDRGVDDTVLTAATGAESLIGAAAGTTVGGAAGISNGVDIPGQHAIARLRLASSTAGSLSDSARSSSARAPSAVMNDWCGSS